MNKKKIMELYKKVEIKSEKDLPKEDGYYFVNVGDKYDIPEDVFRWENGNDRIKRDWLDIDWYLQPVDTAEIVDMRVDLLKEATYMYLKLVKMYSDLVDLCETSQYHEVIRAKLLLKEEIGKLKKELNIE